MVTDVPLLRSKQEEHFLSSPSSFFPLLSRNPTGTLAGFRSQTRSLHGNSYLLPYGRQELHLTRGLSRPLFERIIQILVIDPRD